MTTIICDAAAIAKVLRDVKSVVKPRKTLAILSHVLIDARDGEVSITATDMDMAITRTFPAEVETAGAFTVEAARFTDVVGSFGDGAQLKLVANEGFVGLTCNRSKFRFPTLPAADFPPLPFDTAVAEFDGSPRLLQALAAVRHAVSTVETRYFLCGAKIANRDGLEIAATDGDQCLAVCRPDLQADIKDLILGVGAMDAIMKREGEFKVEIGAASDGSYSRIRFTWPDTVITASLIDGTFPEYTKVIPTGETAAEVDGDEVKNALSRIAMLSDDKARSVKFDFEPGKLTIASRSVSTEDALDRAGGGGVEEMPCEYAGKPMSVTFKASIVRDAIVSLDADRIVFGIRSGAEPVKVTSPARPDMVLVAMPMRA